MSPLFGRLINSNLNMSRGNGQQVSIPNSDNIDIGSWFDFAPIVSGTKIARPEKWLRQPANHTCNLW
jgi:hypothetical protein